MTARHRPHAVARPAKPKRPRVKAAPVHHVHKVTAKHSAAATHKKVAKAVHNTVIHGTRREHPKII